MAGFREVMGHMRDDDLIGLILMVALLVGLVVVLLALVAGSVVSQLLAPFPSVSGPFGAGVALTVFVGIALKILQIIFG